MEILAAFVAEHINDDTTRLIMNRSKWPEIDMDLAVNCIESRRKLKGKVQEWCDEPRMIFPRKLSAEQCSSSATGRYKAELAERIAEIDYINIETSEDACRDGIKKGWKIADLTGGLGVDSWFFSQKAGQVLYCEMLQELCKAAKHNFVVLGAENISVRNVAVATGAEISPLATLGRNDNVMSSEDKVRDEASVFRSPGQILKDFRPDIVYMDPARRGEGGKKVFLIEDCTPDVLTLKEGIFTHTRHILLKLSPMADITMVCDRLGKCCREVHIVASGSECKELLVWMDREWDDEYTIHAVELHKYGKTGVVSFMPSEERIASQTGNKWKEAGNDGESSCSPQIGHQYLFEPGKALMKAGAFNLIAERFCLYKLGKSTHYYTFSTSESITDAEGLLNCHDKEGAECVEYSNTIDQLKQLGKVFRIIRCEPLDKRTIKAAGKEFPHSEVTARNIPMDTDTLRKKLGVTSGDDAHIFGLKSDSAGMLLFICLAIR